MLLHFLIWDHIICGCLLVFLLDQEFLVFGYHLCFCFGSLEVVGREQKVMLSENKYEAQCFFFIPLVVRCVHFFYLGIFDGICLIFVFSGLLKLHIFFQIFYLLLGMSTKMIF